MLYSKWWCLMRSFRFRKIKMETNTLIWLKRNKTWAKSATHIPSQKISFFFPRHHFIGHRNRIVEMLWKLTWFHIVCVFVSIFPFVVNVRIHDIRKWLSLFVTFRSQQAIKGKHFFDAIYYYIPVYYISKIRLFFRRSISLQFTLFAAQQRIRPATDIANERRAQ